MSLGRGNEWYLGRIYHLLYKHQCFIKISATEKIHLFSHVKKYDIFTCKNISQSEIRKSSFLAIATCAFVGIRRGSFSIAREFAKEVSSHSLFLGGFPLISCERFVTFDIREFIDNEENSNTRKKMKNDMALLS